mmetsp:Transcript_33949/g.101523  ORF Transcript_33949/g.101523 Transcript_33949/m.101523 type:complete len:370 (-) Transcript_33949:220-1329(-)
MSSFTSARTRSSTSGRTLCRTSSTSCRCAKLSRSSRCCHLSDHSWYESFIVLIKCGGSGGGPSPSSSAPFLPSFLPSFFGSFLASAPFSSAPSAASPGIGFSTSSGGKSGNLPSRSRYRMYQSRSWSIISSFMSGPSVSYTTASCATSASRYSASCCICICLRRALVCRSRSRGSPSLGKGGGGAIPMKTSSSSRISAVALRLALPLQAACRLVAAASGPSSSPSSSAARRLSSQASLSRAALTPSARCCPCRPRSLAWIILSASSMSICTAGSSSPCSSRLAWRLSSASRSRSRSASVRPWSSTMYFGTGTSSTSGPSLRSTSTSSRLKNGTPPFFSTRTSRSSSSRPITPSSDLRTSLRFCGWTVWS